MFFVAGYYYDDDDHGIMNMLERNTIMVHTNFME